MAGCWPSSFFTSLWTETESKSLNAQKIVERAQYPAILTEKAWSMKDLLFGFRGLKFSGGTRRVIPNGEESGSILPAHGASQVQQTI